MDTISTMPLADVPTEHLEAELVSHAAWEAAGMARMIAVLGEFDRRGIWAAWECRSPQQWLSWKCGLGMVAASERLRVARVLPSLPTISAEFGRGNLSWSKVRELTRVATAENEHKLCDIALAGTAAHVSRVVSAMRRCTREQAVKQIADRSFRWHTDADGSVVISCRLPAEVAMSVVSAVRQAATLARDVPLSTSMADAVVAVVLRGRDAVPDVVVHVDEDCAAIEGGPAIAPEIAECLACNGPVTTVVDTPHGPIVKDRRPAPSRRQRRWLALRHRTCQFPGCHHDGRFEVHHVVERRHGGRTRLANLVRMCGFHHRMVHLHRLQLTLHPDRRIEVRFPDGNPVDRSITVSEFLAPPPTDPDAISSTWFGEHLSMTDALAALLPQPVGFS